METYKCSTCKEFLPRDRFGSDRSASRGFSYRCKSCNSARSSARAMIPEVREARRLASKEWYAANPDRVMEYRKANKDRMRDSRYMLDYKITLREYDEKLAAQGGGCAICSGVNPDGKRLAVDHDHSCCPGKKSCGKCVRDLLCDACNHGIGRFMDDVERMARAIEYLERHRR